ncbi:MAG TPA: VOC family protein [Vicinamibacteria bacterium]|jgi:lactoylglutathione lyase|nr:VOC family protein [Vicinamibacteria bacterium]
MTANLTPDLVVSNVEQSVAFYREALGLSEEDRVAGPEGPIWAMLSRNGFRLMVESVQAQNPSIKALFAKQGPSPRATITLYLSTENVAGEEARLKRAGVAYEGPVTRPYGMKEVAFADPDGYSWTIGEKVSD